MSVKDGGPAFPRPLSVLGETFYQEQEGMSLRDYFAAHAPPMPDEWASYRRVDVSDNESPEQELRLEVQWRLRFADAILAARELGRAVSP